MWTGSSSTRDTSGRGSISPPLSPIRAQSALYVVSANRIERDLAPPHDGYVPASGDGACGRRHASCAQRSVPSSSNRPAADFPPVIEVRYALHLD